MPNAPLSLRRLSNKEKDIEAVLETFENSPSYFLRVNGSLATRADAESAIEALPKGKKHEDKYLWGVYLKNEVIGFADLVRGYPNSKTAMLGLLILSEKHQHKGYGKETFRLLIDIIRGWKVCKIIRIGIIQTNKEVSAFWKQLGFQPTGEIKPYRSGTISSETHVYELNITP